MKKLKLKVISSLISAALIMPMAVHAQGTSTTFGDGLIKQQQHLQLVQERQQFKANMLQKKDTIKKNHETIQGLRKTVTDKRAAVKAAINNIKQSKKQLTSDDLSKIEAQLKLIQNDMSTLQATNGTMKQAFTQFKSDVQGKKYDAAASDLDKVISIQNTRISKLTNLSSDLDSLLSLFQSASANSSAQSSTAGA
ncbi:hypothetical protein [Candidatus Clostridium stratigraminis]|uniref:Uncharacterized protein n=1 Tax=Candidatus Clostridium stratigraminis TaxID=3381661 RepID=A0ABW8SYA2_9CLOT